MMYQTIRLSSCVSVQGEFVASLADGKIVIRDGGTEYRGRPVGDRSGPLAMGASDGAREGAARQG